MDIEFTKYSDYSGKAPFHDKKGHARIKPSAMFDNLGAQSNPSTFSKEEVKFEPTSESSSFPVSEPATMLLLGVGLAGLSGFWKKFKI
jgi:hypothetical protein